MEATRPTTAEPSPATISAVQKFLAEVDSKNRDAESSAFSEYAMQFLKIRLESDDFREMTDFTCDAGGAMENLIKNRYRDVLPYDFNRVKLRLSGSSASDYINASYINGCDGRVGYIATQGPLEHTVDAFWSMIAQCRVKTIIMLCELVEDGKTKCSKYWPSIKEKKSYGNIKVSLVEESKLNIHYTVRRMSLRQDNEKREVKQFHFHQWPDHSTPEEIGPLLDFLELVREHQPETNAEPLVVHCSAGCGRTGTFCALDYARCLFKTEKLAAGFSVYGLVYDLRKQRPAMVQTREQYVLLHQSIYMLFKRFLDVFGLSVEMPAAAAAASTTNDGSGEQTKDAAARNETTTEVTTAPPAASAKCDNASLRQNACNSNASPERNELANTIDKKGESAVDDDVESESQHEKVQSCCGTTVPMTDQIVNV
ncbi:tyrosine protein phosphatase non receptor type [Trichuris trichiura]|uniref:protein-tyrosine-phosphatase n=1 Tax=Trichuris trichiura TaxID=36087 RepID=A0A077Z2A4_TRITR|nr:tyrosine protein phosphatase non receptor type [Trichuris trichiura]